MKKEPRPLSEIDKLQIKNVTYFVLGTLLILGPGWLLFFKLDFLSHPKLFIHFPKAYILIISLFVSGIVVTMMGFIGMGRLQKIKSSDSISNHSKSK